MPTNRLEILKILGDCRAVIIDSHVVYTSGKHGSAYINKDAVYPHTVETSRLCHMLANEFLDDRAQVVIAPAVGGVALEQWVAYHLSFLTGHEILGTYADKTDDGNFIIKRGYDKLVDGARVLVVEDVINTGGSVKKVIEAVRARGGDVVGVGALCNRGGITAQDLGVPKLIALMEIKLQMWDEKDCPYCEQDVPINTDVGKGRAFLDQKMLYTT